MGRREDDGEDECDDEEGKGKCGESAEQGDAFHAEKGAECSEEDAHLGELVDVGAFIDGDEVGECFAGGCCLRDEPGEGGDEKKRSDEVAADVAEVISGDVECALAFFVAHEDDAKAYEPKKCVANDDGEDGAVEAVFLEDEDAGGKDG